MNSWDELIKAFDLGLVEEEKSIEYEHRLYYDSNGHITKSTALKSDTVYDQPFLVVEDLPNDLYNYVIRNNKLMKKINYNQQITQLVKSNTGFQVVLNNPALLIYGNESYAETEYYDFRNN